MTDSNWLPDGGTFDGAHEYVLLCPGCDRRKFSWNTQKKVGHCFRCGHTLTGMKMLRETFMGVGSSTSRPSVTFKSPGRPRDEAYLPVEYIPHALAYLVGRGISLSLAREIGVLYSGGRVWFPVSSPLGGAPFMVGRDITGASMIPWKSFPSEKGRYIFGKLPVGGTIVLVEGIIDLLAPRLWGHGVALLGSHPSVDILTWIGNHYSRVFLWLDPDEAGEKGTVLIRNILKGWFPKVSVSICPYLFGDKDAGDHTPEEAREVLKAVGYVL